MTHQGDVGGSTNSITWLTRGLAGRGHEVWLACRPESLIARRFRGGNVGLVEARLPRGPRLLAEAARWRRWIAAHRIDVVNAHASLDRHLVSYVRVLGTPAAVVHTRRNLALSSGGWIKSRFDASTSDAIIAVSQGVADDLVRRGVPASRVHVVRNGLPLSELRPPDPGRAAALRSELALRDGVPVVGVVARRKSQEELLAAASGLGRPVEIVLAGTDADDGLRAAEAALPDDVRVHVLGFRDDVPEILALLDVFALPSGIEGFSLALLEAMARGLPCIASDAGGNREALEDEAGLLYVPGDVDGLRKALARLLGDPDAARATGERARVRAFAEFDVARTVARTEAVYDSVRGGGAG
jgi:glycosyltransferase involved in cell wall biosynthesis